MPILDSIISSDDCSLKYIQIPQKWKWRRRNTAGELSQFIERYNQQPYTRELSCAKCNGDLNDRVTWLNGLLQTTRICYECLDPLCDNCARMNDRANFCDVCKKEYCSDCALITRCASCSEAYCEGCGGMEECDGLRTLIAGTVCIVVIVAV